MLLQRKKSEPIANNEGSMAKRRPFAVNHHLPIVNQSAVLNQRLSIILRISYLLLLFLIISCNSPYVPKPAGYFKIDLPLKSYQQFNQQVILIHLNIQHMHLL